MSTEALDWARGIKGRSLAQRDLLLALASVADARGSVGPLRALDLSGSGITLMEAEKTAEALLRVGLVSKRWNPDIYQWVWFCNLP